MEEFLEIQNLLNEDFFREKDDSIDKIIKEIEKFDILDFITRLAALNLISENQNKVVLFDYVVARVLELKKGDKEAKMSDGKFKKIIRKIENTSLSAQIDPIECMFVSNVMYYKNYLVFQGINNHSAYNLQSLIDVLMGEHQDLPYEFVMRASKFIKVILDISNKIAKDLNITTKNTKYINIDSRSIEIPNKAKLNKICDAIRINTAELKNKLGYDELIKDIYSEWGQSKKDKIDIDNLRFFNSPFVEDKDKTVILNVSLLPAYILHRIILLANDYECKEKLLEKYNNRAFNESKKALFALGHKSLKSENWNIKLEDNLIYKESIYSVYNDKILILRFLCDERKEYGEDEIFEYRDSKDISSLFEKRTKYLDEKLKTKNVLKQNVFEVIIMNSTGRILNCMINNRISAYKPIKLHPSELEDIAINESDIYMFLPRYIKAKSKLRMAMESVFSELNLVELYTTHQYSFYLDDTFSPTKSDIFLYGEYAIDYIIKANEKADRQMTESYIKNCYAKIRKSSDRNIYSLADESFFDRNLLVKYNYMDIWITAPQAKNSKEFEIYNSLIDCLSYWLSELEAMVENEIVESKTLVIELKLDGNIEKFFEMKDLSKVNLKDNIEINKINNSIYININDLGFGLFASKGNKIEKAYTLMVLNEIFSEKFIKSNKKIIDKIFENQSKKKFMSIQLNNNPMGKYVNDKRIRKIRLEDEAELLDFIGERILKENNNQYGIISDDKRNEVANKVVGYLYEMLKSSVQNLPHDGLIELLIFELEKVAFNTYLSKKRYESEVLCYPEKTQDYINEFSELNKSSRALKFLVEYVVATPIEGTERLGEWEFEKILAICSQIIDWAYKNDLFRFNIFNTPVEILKSDRIGMKQDEFNKLELLNRKIMDESLKGGNYGGTSILDDIKLFNEAFIDEVGFSFEELKEVIWTLINLNHNEVGVYEVDTVISKINELEIEITLEKIRKIIEYISLTKRDDFLKPPKGYKKEDVYPWKFNRELSFTRRPVILRENKLIWGNRQLYHMLIYIIDGINEGKFKFKTKKMQKLVGNATNKRGEAFNDAVYEKIKGYGFKVFKNIKKINRKKIADENNNTLGDIDILYIIPKRKIVVVGEVKDFNFSKSPYEMQMEYEKMFKDTDKKSFATKHKRRCEWVKEHIEDIKIEFGLANVKWRVKSIFLVNEPIISNAFYGEKLKIIIFNDINIKQLENI